MTGTRPTRTEAATAMSTTTNRDWIAAEFRKGIDAEQALLADSRSRAENAPAPELTVLYHEIASADERHLAIVEAIATRYGHTPGKTSGIGEAIGRLKDKVAEMGSTPLDRLGHDLAAKANAIHWSTAWVRAFEGIGDTESARELAAVLTEDKSHHAALQEALTRMVVAGASVEEPVAAGAAK